MIVTLKDVANTESKKTLDVHIPELENDMILWIRPEGYGDHSSEDGNGFPIGIEVYEGRLRVLVWDDINAENPRIIDMERARESNRREANVA